MSLIESQAVRAVLLAIGLAVIFAGVLFAALAGFLALAPHMEGAWAALIVAAVLLVPVLTGAFIVRGSAAHVARPQPAAAAAAPSPDEATVAMIAGMAKEKPLLAVLFAGLLGAAGTVLQARSRPR